MTPATVPLSTVLTARSRTTASAASKARREAIVFAVTRANAYRLSSGSSSRFVRYASIARPVPVAYAGISEPSLTLKRNWLSVSSTAT